jgi:hypothetical protein
MREFLSPCTALKAENSKNKKELRKISDHFKDAAEEAMNWQRAQDRLLIQLKQVGRSYATFAVASCMKRMYFILGQGERCAFPFRK